MGIAPKNYAREQDEAAVERPLLRSRSKSQYATLKHLEALAEQVVEYVDGALSREFEPRIKALEENQVTFGDTWKDGQSYPEKCIVTHGGSAWLSKMPNNVTKPGDGLAWRLIVKRGRDGKDGKDAAR
jgi:hypothetical protein